MRFLLHVMSSIMKFIIINYEFLAKSQYSPLHQIQVQHREALKFKAINSQVRHLNNLLGRKKTKMLSFCPSLHCFIRRQYLLKTACSNSWVDRFRAGWGTSQISTKSDEKRGRLRGVSFDVHMLHQRRSKSCSS